MRFKYRKPITSHTLKEVDERLAFHFPIKQGDYPLEFCIGAGWADIVFDLNEKLETESPKYQILQIKEKFGGLRFYTDGLTYAGWDYVSEAEKLSFKTCEECGRSGKIWNHRGWVKNLCWLDNMINQTNQQLWNLEKLGLKAFFKNYFLYRRVWRRIRKERAKNDI